MGRVRSIRPCRRHGGRTPYLVKIRQTKIGYQRFDVYRSRQRATLSLARVVLTAFVGPCPSGHEAAHLDGDPSNNHLNNLVWSTHSQNLLHKRRHGTMPRGESHWNNRGLTAEKVREMRHLHREGARYCDLARRYGLTRPHVRDICLRKLWAHVT